MLVPMVHPIFPCRLVDFCNIPGKNAPQTCAQLSKKEISWPRSDAFMLCIDGSMNLPRIAIDFRRNVEETSQVKWQWFAPRGVWWNFLKFQVDSRSRGWLVCWKPVCWNILLLSTTCIYLLISGAQLYLIYHYVFLPWCYMLESESTSINI